MKTFVSFQTQTDVINDPIKKNRLFDFYENWSALENVIKILYFYNLFIRKKIKWKLE